MYQYRPQNEDELELREGDRVDVMQQCDDGWFVGRWAWRAGCGQVHLRVLGDWAGGQARKGISGSYGDLSGCFCLPGLVQQRFMG